MKHPSSREFFAYWDAKRVPKVDRLVLLAFGQSFAAALELSGAHDPVVHIERVEPESALFRVVWG